jgi:hypothetical protein
MRRHSRVAPQAKYCHSKVQQNSREFHKKNMLLVPDNNIDLRQHNIAASSCSSDKGIPEVQSSGCSTMKCTGS